ncbi:hypothetical protein F2Q69_00025152 [Brassica cretica]|uniref:Uncharacterized protein n=1 Tax=Brassica cretica TaxID=69181 RepID=A0A8S9QGQ6_BRACR|nr:hypothetical protein F2Q69_00025152 [Brassica cretica]
MGIIETGTVSGNLLSKETFVVHYPGYPSSISRALENGSTGSSFNNEVHAHINEMNLPGILARGNSAKILGEAARVSGRFVS